MGQSTVTIALHWMPPNRRLRRVAPACPSIQRTLTTVPATRTAARLTKAHTAKLASAKTVAFARASAHALPVSRTTRSGKSAMHRVLAERHATCASVRPAPTVPFPLPNLATRVSSATRRISPACLASARPRIRTRTVSAAAVEDAPSAMAMTRS